MATTQNNIINEMITKLNAIKQFRIVGKFPEDYSNISITNLPSCILYVGDTEIENTSTGRYKNTTNISIVFMISNKNSRLQKILDMQKLIIDTISNNTIYDNQNIIINKINIESGNISQQLDQLSAGDTNQISQKVITFSISYWTCNSI